MVLGYCKKILTANFISFQMHEEDVVLYFYHVSLPSGPALVTTKDAGDAITLLQSLAGSTFDSSQLVLTACMGFLTVTEVRLVELREKLRPSVLAVIEERTKKGRVWKDSKGLASKLYSFKHDPGSPAEGKKTTEGADGGPRTPNVEDFLSGLAGDSETESLPDLQEQVTPFFIGNLVSPNICLSIVICCFLHSEEGQ